MRKSILILFFLLIFTSISFAQGGMMPGPGVKGYAAAGGQWFYPPNVTSEPSWGSTYGSSTTTYGNEISPISSGSCTKLSFKLATTGTASNCKVEIYDIGNDCSAINGLTCLGSKTISSISIGWNDANLDSSVSITSGHCYGIMFMCDGNGGTFYYNSGGGGERYYLTNYASFPVCPANISKLTHKIAVRMWVE